MKIIFCKNCGQSLSSKDSVCPNCESSEREFSTSDNVLFTSVMTADMLKLINYPMDASSRAIVRDLVQTSGATLEPQEIEALETITERSKWLGAGIKFHIGFTDRGFGIAIEKKPTKEAQRITKIIWRRPEEK